MLKKKKYSKFNNEKILHYKLIDSCDKTHPAPIFGFILSNRKSNLIFSKSIFIFFSFFYYSLYNFITVI